MMSLVIIFTDLDSFILANMTNLKISEHNKLMVEARPGLGDQFVSKSHLM